MSSTSRFLDSRRAFLDAATTLIAGYLQLASYKLVGNTAQICLLEVNALDKLSYKDLNVRAIRELQAIGAREFEVFVDVFQDSSIILAISWLESFVLEVEEALYLQNPRNLGEQVQVKLGKIVDADSIEKLLHDVIRRRIRERSQWGLANRLRDLEQNHGFNFTIDHSEIDWATRLRNEVVHNKRMGAYHVKRKRVSYRAASEKKRKGHEDVDNVIRVVGTTIVDLYGGACAALKINGRFRSHTRIKQMLNSLWIFK